MDDGDGSGGGICNPFTQDCGGNITDDIDVGEGGGITLGSLSSSSNPYLFSGSAGTIGGITGGVVHPESWTVTLNKVHCSREGVQHASKTKFQRRVQGKGSAGDYQRNQECGGNLSRA